MVTIENEWRAKALNEENSRGRKARRHAVICADHGAVEVDEDFSAPGLPPMISFLMVQRGARRKGLGAELLDAAEALCKRWGYDKCRLEFDERDSPLWVSEWYRRRGYEDIMFGGRPGCWHVLYEKNLGE